MRVLFTAIFLLMLIMAAIFEAVFEYQKFMFYWNFNHP